MITLICPLCGDTCFERLLTLDGAAVAVTLVAFRCTGNGPFFFRLANKSLQHFTYPLATLICNAPFRLLGECPSTGTNFVFKRYLEA
jgi:hypothetical protein